MQKLSKQFKIIIERDEDGLFTATVPALPGCHTQAKTLSELTARVKDAVKLCLSVAKTDVRYRKRIQTFGYEPLFVGVESINIS